MNTIQSVKYPNRIYQCIINHIGDEKYVLLRCEPYKLTDDDGKDLTDIKELYVFSSCDSEDYHSGQLKWYISETESQLKGIWRSPECLGGGIIDFNPSESKLKCYGTSYGFGDPDIEIVRDILETFYPDFQRNVNVTNYVRG
ncbi:hypothetical protein DLAC_11590 [Tieghemostelium lacteum]|uniref:Uncharacterized protein n=1 Tax=Tieghemostelium lacteum TaxID=361077 RepID=A0A151ZK39_TIELA|nr:hypothetical protein DLAC_11590 [Tieghemostelium lacteum]|eukprot:KYQ94269.1 hypothetical protein DLAC_11590 [Tieghemostelium lacteum]